MIETGEILQTMQMGDTGLGNQIKKCGWFFLHNGKGILHSNIPPFF